MHDGYDDDEDFTLCDFPGVYKPLEGESLVSLLRRERPGLRRTLELLGAVAAGLAHGHAHGLVHGDLKPSNVFITREGRVKLLGFGLAHLMSPTASMSGCSAWPRIRGKWAFGDLEPGTRLPRGR